ncbi:MAG TPA: hydroxyacid dehydrogenase [Candidatus Hungatella pullicola]|nr:hydroxyacid dehydrogenase [Candidatus Hungatella pullicola]
MKKDLRRLGTFPQEKMGMADKILDQELKEDRHKIVVLDDDPTGTQTVHGVSVYTDWSEESIARGFKGKEKVFYILTNSRSFSPERTIQVHRQIGERVEKAAREQGTEYLILSRGDSTLRGHYPLETEILREVLEQKGYTIDGEIICPYFGEGGRYTVDNIHYVKQGDWLIPCGETEFAQDKTFGYHFSDLTEYIEEKTRGKCKAGEVLTISLKALRNLDVEGITHSLMGAENFKKIIVNAVCDYDLKVFSAALYRAMKSGKRFLFRCAASLVKILGGIKEKPLLDCSQLFCHGETDRGGIILIGSHTRKTTEQLEQLKEIRGICFHEMNTDLVLVPGALENEIRRLAAICSSQIAAGTTVAVYTKRQILSLEGDTRETALARSVEISKGVQALAGLLEAAPSFVVAKGGITSSDVATGGLRIQRAAVLGQIAPGVPVWRTGEESRFPGIPYVIFPGNVGEKDTLKCVVKQLLGLADGGKEM